MKSETETPADSEDIRVPRWVQLPVGFVLGLFALLSLAGSIALVSQPNEKAPVLAPIVGAVMALTCCWVLTMSWRLITGKGQERGLMSPRTLRFIAWPFLLMPVGGLFTGYFYTHSFTALIQTAAYIGFFVGLRHLAAQRESHGA